MSAKDLTGIYPPISMVNSFDKADTMLDGPNGLSRRGSEAGRLWKEGGEVLDSLHFSQGHKHSLERLIITSV